MSAARTARRRRRQWAINHTHMARIGKGPNNRPMYKRKSLLGVHEAIAREREFTRRQALIKRKS